jgi:phage terminase small subunit
MTEYTLGEEPEETPPSWQDHDWTIEEVTFVAAYLRTGNGAAAYREAFARNADKLDSPKASFRGSLILRRRHVRDYIAAMQAEIKARMALTKENVLEELGRLGFANMTDFVVLQANGTPQFDFSGLSREQSAAIQEMTIDTYVDGAGEDGLTVRSVKVKLAPKINALELLGKHFKLFTDVVENHTVGDVSDEIVAARKARQERMRQQQEEDGSDGNESVDGSEAEQVGDADRGNGG